MFSKGWFRNVVIPAFRLPALATSMRSSAISRVIASPKMLRHALCVHMNSGFMNWLRRTWNIGSEGEKAHYLHVVYSICQMRNIDPSEVFAALSNPVRLRCLFLVARNDEVCVCEVEEALRIAQPSASKALNALKSAGLLAARRDANWNYYRLNDDMPQWMADIVARTVSELSGREPHVADKKRLDRLDLRPTCA
jgi:ArsR family transcriptional regulator